LESFQSLFKDDIRVAGKKILTYLDIEPVFIRRDNTMKFRLFPLAVLALTCLGTAAHAQTSRIYFAGYLGMSAFPGFEFDDEQTPASGHFDPDNTPNFAGALGLRFTRNFRMEAEFSYRDADFGSVTIEGAGEQPVTGELKSSIFLLNGYYDFNIRGWKTQPFVNAGVGFGYHSGEIFDSNGFTRSVADEKLGLIYSAGGGLKYRVKDNMAWTAGYRYLDGSDISFDNTNIDYSSHEIRVGLEWDIGP
jgi:opacity protein-like surface antigen